MIFLNKLDRPGASFRSSLLSLLSHHLHPKPMALAIPIASFDPQDYNRAEPGICGLIDLVKWELWKWDAHGECMRFPLPNTVEDVVKIAALPASHPLLSHLIPARTALLDNIAMFSQELMETLLSLPPGPSSYLGVDSSAIMPHLRAACLRNEILPVLGGSATKHIGTELLLDYVGELLASPLDIKHDQQIKNPPVQLLAWKVGWDKRRGGMTFVRIYSGDCLTSSVEGPPHPVFSFSCRNSDQTDRPPQY